MHGIVSPLRDAQHHLKAVLYLSLTLLTTGEQLLEETDRKGERKRGRYGETETERERE